MDWEYFTNSDVEAELPGHGLPAKTPEDVDLCKHECLRLGFGGFVVRKGQATFRKSRRDELLEGRSHGFFDRGADLYVAPLIEPVEPCDVKIAFGDVAFDCQRHFLQANSGYFAAAMRHGWQDWQTGPASGETYRFHDFPGGRAAFSLAMSWFACSKCAGPPWPLGNWQDFCLVMEAAVYLDSLSLLMAAARSFRFSAGQNFELQLATKLSKAAGHFGQEDVVREMQDVLRVLPRHQLHLSDELIETAATGLAALDTFEAAPETFVGHIKSVGSLIVGQSPHSSPHSFAVKLFQHHEAHFTNAGNPYDLQRLLHHVDAGKPIPRPLAFRLAAAAAQSQRAQAAQAAQAAQEVPLGSNLAQRIFERCFDTEEDPEDIACDADCLRLFSDSATTGPVLLLDTLARPSVPTSAAAVILSRVLSSWNLEGDAAATIYEGFLRNRSGLRSFVALQDASGHDRADLAVPEIRAAFAFAAKKSLDDIGLLGDVGDSCESQKLLFRFLFRPTGGLPGVRFPIRLLMQLPREGHTELIAHRVLEELRLCGGDLHTDRWLTAQAVWELVAWQEVSDEKVESAVALLRDWLVQGAQGDRRDGVAVELLGALPLLRLSAPQELLAPPVPAHALAILNLQKIQKVQERMAELEAENRQLRMELRRVRSGQDTSG